MSSIEMDLAPGVNRRRQEITNIDAQLKQLNSSFPGERKKPDAAKDPEYMARRTAILEIRQHLSGMQNRDRRILREVNR